jgi:hypothetical protein
LIGLILCLYCSHLCLANTIVIGSKTVIEKDTTYANVTLDLSHGSLIIKNNALLSIINSKIIGTISPDNPFLISSIKGNLALSNIKVNITTSNVTSNPYLPPLYYVLNINQGHVSISDSIFTTEQSYTIGLLITSTTPTSNFVFKNNRLSNLHGGLLLRQSSHGLIANNRFTNVSSSNIFLIESNDILVKNNSILFSGNNNIGDGIDIFDSNNIKLSENKIFSGSCYSVVIIRSKNMLIDNNRIIGGVTYAIYIADTVNFSRFHGRFISRLTNSNLVKHGMNENITVVRNYLAQNRYGLAANNVDGLYVNNNVFIQRFYDSKTRRFWTNNDILLKNIAHVIWENNIYKEAYTQDLEGNNQKSVKFILFPLHGGVIL